MMERVKNLKKEKHLKLIDNLMLNKKIKKIAIVGYGREGKSLADFLLRKRQTNVTILDQNENLLVKQPFKSELGRDYLKKLVNFDLIYVSPGVSCSGKEWAKVKNKISSPTSLFFKLCPAKIIGVTGTKGKGTTCRFLEKIISYHWAGNVFLGGNIGLPLISFLDKVSQQDLVVAELSSFQLQHLKKSPFLAIITNLSVDHLNYHKTINEYYQAKLNILRYQNKNDLAVINASLKEKTEKIGLGKKYYFSIDKKDYSSAYYFQDWLIIKSNFKEEKIIKTSEIKILGQHNQENILAATLAGYLLGIPKEKIASKIRNLKLVEHHLELVLKQKGVKVIDDSAATNPLAMMAAIKSFSWPIILIAGGQDKGFDYSQLEKDLAKEKKRIKKIILLGENKDKFFSVIPKEIKAIKVDSLAEAVKEAWLEVEKDDLILFSPGAASLDMFKNASERGEIFKKLIG